MKKLRQLCLIGLATLSIGLSTLPAQAGEKMTLTTPYDPDSRTTSTWEIDRIEFVPVTRQLVIHLKGENNITRQVIYRDIPGGEQAATNLHRELNRPHASKSQHKKAFQKMIEDRKLEGTCCTGDPD